MTERQKEILFLIVKHFIKINSPVSSSELLKNYDLNISSATIRNEMNILEKEGYIEKNYKAAGRMPTVKGYYFYIDSLKNNPNSIINLKEQVSKIFNSRSKGIDDIFKKIISLINESTNTIAVTITDNENLILQELRMYYINDTKLLIVAIASNGKLFNEEVNIDREIGLENFTKCFNIISLKLSGTKIKDIKAKVNLIVQIVKEEINIKENDFKLFIDNLLNRLFMINNEKTGLNNLISFQNNVTQEQIKNIIKLLNEQNIWDIIENSESFYKGNNKIILDINSKNFGDIAIINKNVKIADEIKKVALIGMKNQDYEKILSILDLLDFNSEGEYE